MTRPEACDRRNGLLVFAPDDGGLVILRASDGSKLKRWRSTRMPPVFTELSLRLDPAAKLIAVCRGQWLFLRDWRTGSDFTWRSRVTSGSLILEVDNHSVYTTGPAGAPDGVAAFDLRGGRQWLRVPSPVKVVWHADGAYIVHRKPSSSSVELLRAAAGRLSRSSVDQMPAGDLRAMVWGGELGLVLLIGDQLIGLDPAGKRGAWRHGPLPDLTREAELYWAGGRRVVVVDDQRLLLFEIGR